MNSKEMKIGDILKARFRILVDTLLKPTFISWVVVTGAIIAKNQPFDVAYYGFTCAIIGVKRYFDLKEGAK